MTKHHQLNRLDKHCVMKQCHNNQPESCPTKCTQPINESITKDESVHPLWSTDLTLPESSHKGENKSFKNQTKGI